MSVVDLTIKEVMYYLGSECNDYLWSPLEPILERFKIIIKKVNGWYKKKTLQN